jgi:CBS domain containing-hemolysin-like protein
MDGTFWIDLLKLAGVAVLVLANGFFVSAEFALVSIRRTRVTELVAQGNSAASWVQRAVNDPDRFIAATQLGITLASLGLGWIGEPALAHLIQPVVDLFPAAIQSGVSHSLSAALAFAVITFLHVVIGELAPKSIALQSTERVALIVARPTVWTEWVFKPFIWLLNGAGNALLRAAGFQPAAGHELVHSVDELKMLVTASAEGGVVELDEEEMLHAVFDFSDTLVRQVMVPRTEMVAVPAEATLESLKDIAIQNPYTKLPVYQDSLDHVLGVVHLKDVLRAMYGKRAGAKTARDLMRETIFVPETARIGTLLKRFRARQQHLAIVLDEYGGTAGVVTLEDLLEEIVGEVSDPFDAEPEIQAMPDGSSLIDGLTLIDEVNEHFGLHLVDPDYDTIAGFMLGKLGRLAQVGDSITVGGAKIRVEAMDGRRIARVSLLPAERTPEARPAADPQP